MIRVFFDQQATLHGTGAICQSEVRDSIRYRTVGSVTAHEWLDTKTPNTDKETGVLGKILAFGESSRAVESGLGKRRRCLSSPSAARNCKELPILDTYPPLNS